MECARPCSLPKRFPQRPLIFWDGFGIVLVHNRKSRRHHNGPRAILVDGNQCKLKLYSCDVSIEVGPNGLPYIHAGVFLFGFPSRSNVLCCTIGPILFIFGLSVTKIWLRLVVVVPWENLGVEKTLPVRPRTLLHATRYLAVLSSLSTRSCFARNDDKTNQKHPRYFLERQEEASEQQLFWQPSRLC